MKIGEIYKKYNIPPNLQEHMLRVYGIVLFIENCWIGEKVDWNNVKTIALLHDMGNLIKFKLDKTPELLGPEQENIEYWIRSQREMIEKYGVDEEEATSKILREIGIDEKLIKMISDKAFGNSVEISKSNDWHLKILYYADLRTLPMGVGSLESRLTDVRNRMPKYTNRPDFEELVNSCREIETQIQKNLKIDVNEIKDDAIEFKMKTLATFEINTK